MRKYREYIIFFVPCILVLVLTILFLAWKVPIRFKIDRTVDGILWSTAETNTEELVTITFEGTYYKYLLNWNNHNDYYRGEIEVSNIKETKGKNKYLGILIMRETNLYDMKVCEGRLNYHDVYKEDSSFIGYIYSFNGFKDGAILLDEEYGENMIISFPCNSRKEAAGVTERVIPFINE